MALVVLETGNLSVHLLTLPPPTVFLSFPFQLFLLSFAPVSVGDLQFFGPIGGEGQYLFHVNVSLCYYRGKELHLNIITVITWHNRAEPGFCERRLKFVGSIFKIIWKLLCCLFPASERNGVRSNLPNHPWVHPRQSHENNKLKRHIHLIWWIFNYMIPLHIWFTYYTTGPLEQ